MLNVKEYLKPRELHEAWDMAKGAKSLYVSGGLMVAQLKTSLERLIDLKSLGLDEIEEKEGYIKVGANVKLSELTKDEMLSKMYDGFFVRFMKNVGSTQIRNMATIGGSVAFRLGWSDVITALMMLRAEVEIFNGKIERMPIEDYISMSRSKEIVTAIFLPIENGKVAFEKFSKSTFDIAVLNVGINLSFENGKIKKSVVVVGSRPMISTRAREVEEFLIGKTLSEVDKTAKLLSETVKVGTDIRASAEYRRALMGSLLKKCMRRIEDESHL